MEISTSVFFGARLVKPLVVAELIDAEFRAELVVVKPAPFFGGVAVLGRHPETLCAEVGLVREAVYGVLAFLVETPRVRIAVGRNVAHVDARFAGV